MILRYILILTISLNIRSAYNRGLAKGGVTCFVETFLQGSKFVIRMNTSAKIHPFAKPKPLPASANNDTATNKQTIK